jgi:hypothetical protein
MTVAALFALALLVGHPPGRLRRRRAPAVDGDAAARLVLLALRAGESVQGAIALAAEEADPVTGAALRRVAHRSRVAGLAGALSGAGTGLAPMIEVLARSEAVGSPVAAELASHLRQSDRDEHMAAVARARSAPVRLALPLTLLILPGVVLMTVGPSIVATVAELIEPGGFLP